MAYITAQKFGTYNTADRFGTPLLANDGNGELYGENVKIETLSYVRSEKLNDIMELRAQMAMSPLEGDDLINALLDMDEQLLQEGRVNRKLITETYPDIDVGQYLLDLLIEDEKIAVTIGEMVGRAKQSRNISVSNFPASPDQMLGLLDELALTEADKLMRIALDRGIADQNDAIKIRQHDETLESPLVPA